MNQDLFGVSVLRPIQACVLQPGSRPTLCRRVLASGVLVEFFLLVAFSCAIAVLGR